MITVLFAGSMACLACYDIARKNPRANLVMIILATAEIYGGELESWMLWTTCVWWGAKKRKELTRRQAT